MEDEEEGVGRSTMSRTSIVVGDHQAYNSTGLRSSRGRLLKSSCLESLVES